MSVIPHIEQQQARQSVPDITAFLQAAVWDLAYAGELPVEQALQLHHAVHLMLSASEQLVLASVRAAMMEEQTH